VLVDGEIVDNPYTMWSEFNADLPAAEIAMAFIPGTKHGTREVFEEKVLLVGCEATGAMEAMIKPPACRKTTPKTPASRCAPTAVGRHRRRLHRDPGAHRRQPNGIGVFGLAFYENNTDKLKVATMSGIAPSTETIASGEYPVSRPLFFYIKKAHIGVIPGLKEYAQFFVSDEMAGPLATAARWPRPSTASWSIRNWPLLGDPGALDRLMAIRDWLRHERALASAWIPKPPPTSVLNLPMCAIVSAPSVWPLAPTSDRRFCARRSVTGR
jgi:hypothetical protein